MLQTNQTKWKLETTNKLNALNSGDLDIIYNVYNGSKTGSWYKFINDDLLLDFVTPVQSDTVNKVLNTLLSVLYSDISITYDNTDSITSFLNEKFFEDLEKQLQLHGEMLLSFEFKDGIKYPVFLRPHEYVSKFNNFGLTTSYNKYFNFEFDEVHYVLETIMYTGVNRIEYYVFEKEKIEWSKVNGTAYSLKDLFEYEIFDNFIDYLGIRQFYTLHHKFAYRLETDFKFSKVVSLVELIDEALTFIKLGTRQSAPSIYIPEDISFDCENGECEDNPIAILKARMTGIVKYPTVPGSEGNQRVDIIQANVDIDGFRHVIENAREEIFSIVGLSKDTMEANLDDAGNGYNSQMEREKLTIRTRNKLITERKRQLTDIFNDMGVTNFDMDFATFGSNISPELLLALNTLEESSNMSKEVMVKLMYPQWNKTQVDEEIERLKILEEQKIENQIRLAGHAQDLKTNNKINN